MFAMVNMLIGCCWFSFGGFDGCLFFGCCVLVG